MNLLSIGNRTDFSIGESTLTVDSLVKRAKELGLQSVAVCDTMSISSMAALTSACEKESIKPVIGCTLRVYDDPTYRKPAKKSGEAVKDNPSVMVKVFPKTERGLKSLLKVLTKGGSEEYFYYHSRIGWGELFELEECILTTGDVYGLFHHPRPAEKLSELAEHYGLENLFIEVVPVNTPLYDRLNRDAIIAARSLGMSYNLVASYPAFYTQDDRADTLDVMRVICGNQKMDSPWRQIPYVRDFSVKSPASLIASLREMKTRLVEDGLEPSTSEMRSAVENLQLIGDAITYKFEKMAPCLPKMAENEFAALVGKVKEGWNKRMFVDVLGFKPDESKLPQYKDRLAYELTVLKNLGFSNYFLVVEDIVTWSKSQGIIVGPGRGSVGGSLVAYLLGITDCDPIRFNLFFERFINPDRIDLPDADLDFMSTRRSEVIDYIVTRFGRECVAGISNYNSLGAASALRNVSRVYDLNPFEYSCSKLVEKENGMSSSLEESATTVPELDAFKTKFPKIWSHSVGLEGITRSMGQHAAGVIVAGEPIVNRAVIETRGESHVVNWDKRYVEDFGLIKMDILGLSTLDVLARALEYIEKRHGSKINLLDVPLDAPDVLDAFGKGETTGVFQFEGSGATKLLKSLAEGGRLSFEDLAASTALNRPGPLDAGLCDAYVRRRTGRERVSFDHPVLKSSLSETYGVLVYQEQIMQVARDLSGFSMAEADQIRKAIGKKDLEKMALMGSKFIQGAIEKSGMHELNAKALWADIEGFASYAFNKSHSVEYTIISYWCMYLKVRYPAEFFAGILSIQDKEEKVEMAVKDCQKAGISVLPPDINISTDRVEVKDEKTLVAPFQAIKGISENVANYILAVRASHEKPFESRADFDKACVSAGLSGKINVRHRERLDLVGAFASIEPTQPSATDSSRTKDRLELMPGFTVESVKATRKIMLTKDTMGEVAKINAEVMECANCDLSDCDHARARGGKTPKFMVIFDSPSYHEGQAGQMLEKDRKIILNELLKEVGLNGSDGYYTSLIKAVKPKEVKQFTTAQINGCKGYLEREIELLKPPVIVAMGSAAARYLMPGMKGGIADMNGKTLYKPDIDATVLITINPSMIVFDPSKINLLKTAFTELANLVVSDE